MIEWKGKGKKGGKPQKKLHHQSSPQDQKQELNETIDLLKIVDDNGNLEVETKKWRKFGCWLGLLNEDFARKEKKEKERKKN